MMNVKEVTKGQKMEPTDWGKIVMISQKDKFLNDGPAVESVDGDKAWWLNAKLHRETLDIFNHPL